MIVARGSDYLLVDISNSYAKFAFASATRVFGPTRIVTGKLSSRVISRLLGKRNVGKVVVSSVVPAKDSAILKAAGKTKVVWLNWKLKMGVEIDYPKPQSIGADRLANAAAVALLRAGRSSDLRHGRSDGRAARPRQRPPDTAASDGHTPCRRRRGRAATRRLLSARVDATRWPPHRRDAAPPGRARS